MQVDRVFADASSAVAKAAGRPLAFVTAGLLVVAWGIAGPFAHLSDSWQLMINTTSSIVTFLMVFLIQNTQARDSEAIHAKLDDLLAVLPRTDERLIGIERLPDKEIEEFRARTLLRSHSDQRQPITAGQLAGETRVKPNEQPPS